MTYGEIAVDGFLSDKVFLCGIWWIFLEKSITFAVLLAQTTIRKAHTAKKSISI